MHLTFREHFFKHHRKLEIGFVIFYNLEALFKIFCLSFRGYITRWVRSLSKLSNIFKALPSWKKLDFYRTIHKFEFLLCVMTSIHVLPGMFLTPISIFQVFLKQTDMDKEQEMNIALFVCDQLSTDRQTAGVFICRPNFKKRKSHRNKLHLLVH